MSDLIIIAFPDDSTAFEARAELSKLAREYLIEMEDIVVVTRGEDGRVTLHQAVNLTAAGAVGGTLWGGLIGLLFLNPLLGAAVGAGAGALSGRLTDIGIDDGFLKETGAALAPGTAALGVLVRKVEVDKLLERLPMLRAKGQVLQTSLPADIDAKLHAHFDSGAPIAGDPAEAEGPGGTPTMIRAAIPGSASSVGGT